MTTRLLRRYRIGPLLGAGAFASVHAAHDEQLDDPVAVKILAHNHAANPEMKQRFVAEGQILRRLSSPHLVAVHDLAEAEDGRPFLVLELCDRGTLKERVEQARAGGWVPTDGDAVHIATALAAAIQTLADADVVHRDLTPSNILLTTRRNRTPTLARPSTLIAADEHVVVSDLGFCKDLAATTRISATGGTQGFQPPEQRTVGGTIDARSDVWAAAAVLCWTLTGEMANTPADATQKITESGISQPLAQAIAAGLHPSPDQRPDAASGWLAAITSAAGPARSQNFSHDNDAIVHPTGDDHPPSHIASVDLAKADQSHGWVIDRTAMAAIAAGLLLLFIVNTVARNATEDDLPEAPQRAVVDAETIVPAVAVPTPTVAPPDLGPAMGGDWEFELTTRDGWEYHIDVAIAFAFLLDTTIQDTAPAGARVRGAFEGGADTRITSTTTSRPDPPELNAKVVAYFTDEFLPDRFRIGPCEPWTRDTSAENRRYAWACELNDPRPFERWFTGGEFDQDKVTSFVQQANGRQADFYVMTIDTYCEFVLIPDGRVVSKYDSCQAAGPAAVETAPDIDILWHQF